MVALPGRSVQHLAQPLQAPGPSGTAYDSVARGTHAWCRSRWPRGTRRHARLDLQHFRRRGTRPVPVSTARAERDAIAAASTAGALRRQTGGNNPLQLARRIGAALNVGIIDFGSFWVTGVTTDGRVVVANNYGLAYIPDRVNLPQQVHMATADESIPIDERAKWATYPILAVQGWAQHHNVALRAVVATDAQFANFDPSVAKIVLQPDDIPDSGTMEGRNRLEVIAPHAAAHLASISDVSLTELLPPAPADINPPADETHALWFEVAKPLMSTSTQRSVAHLQALVTYANHAQELAVYRAHTATDTVTQRAAIADWVYSATPWRADLRRDQQRRIGLAPAQRGS